MINNSGRTHIPLKTLAELDWLYWVTPSTQSLFHVFKLFIPLVEFDFHHFIQYVDTSYCIKSPQKKPNKLQIGNQ